jgi:iron(III) transport system substrate-binding protein
MSDRAVHPGRLLNLAILLIAVTLSACGNAAQPSATPQVQPLPTSTPRSLVVYSGRSEALVGPIIKQFSDATGIKVNVKYGSTSALAATLLEEGARTPADIYFAQDPGDLGAVQSLLAPLPADILGAVPTWARSPEGRWVGISGRARTVVYNTERLKETDLPDSIWEFTDPKWQGKVGWAPANASFQAMVSSMRLLWGEGKTLQWLNGMRANQPKVFPNNTSIVKAVGAGEIEVGFVNHYYLHQFLAEEGEGFKARNYFTRATDAGSIVLVAGAGITASSKAQETAQTFLRFLLSAPAQQYFASQTYEYPLVAGVAKNRLLPDMQALHRPEVDLSLLSDVKGTQALMRTAGIIP